jgi:hypothetical protein
MNATENSSTEAREAVPVDDRSIRPVIEHALTVYFDGNAELASTLIDRLLAEDQNR